MKPTPGLQWIERMRSLGRAQARYLWLLLVVGVFYLAVQDQVILAESGLPGRLRVPLIDLDISASVVWATGPAVLAFILLAYLGSMRAYGYGARVLKLDEPGEPASEPLDTAPNAIDLAMYTTHESAWFVTGPLYFVTPLVVTLFLGEVVWLTYGVYVSPIEIPGRRWWVGAGVVLSLAAGRHIADIWYRRMRSTLDDIGEWWQERRKARKVAD